MKTILLMWALWFAMTRAADAGFISTNGVASWYGEAHRGRLMADGRRFDPDQLTAASWFYPLGTRVRVTAADQPGRSVIVTITDRGPAKKWVSAGRLIDLSRAAFKEIAPPGLGLVRVIVEPIEE